MSVALKQPLIESDLGDGAGDDGSTTPFAQPPAARRRPSNFWQRHFGTDRQWGSFLWVIATALYGAGEVAALLTVAEGGEDDVMGGGGPRLEDINGVLQLLSAALFMWGSWKFYVGNYPDARDELEAELKGFDASSVPFRVRYFTHNDQLLGSWLFALACLPYPIIGIFYIVLADEDSGVSAVGRSHDLLIGWTYVVGGAAMAVAMGAWAATLSPELLAATGGAGTTVLFDSLCACAPASFREDGRVRAMVASDFLFIMWAVLAGMCVVAPVLAVYAVLKPTAMNWCYAASIWVLTWGVAAFGRGHETDVPSKWCNPVACCCNDHEP